MSQADKIYIGRMSLTLAEGLDEIPKEMAEASQLVPQEMLGDYTEQLDNYKQALRYFREVFCVNNGLTDADVYRFADMYKDITVNEFHEHYYNKQSLSESDLFGRPLH